MVGLFYKWNWLDYRVLAYEANLKNKVGILVDIYVQELLWKMNMKY